MQFYMESKQSSEFFRGKVEVDVKIAKPSLTDPTNNTVDRWPNFILVEVSGRMIETLKNREHSELAQV